MDPVTLLGLAVGLSLDAFTVSLANSMAIHNLSLGHGLRMALFFGLFQLLMPVAGWALGSTISSFIGQFDHWLAFALLAFVGGRMVLAQFREEAADGCSDETPGRDCRHLPTLLMLSLATSLDALAVGLSFAFITTDIVLPVIIIGLVTFAICLAGYFLGRRLRHGLKLPLEGIGGTVLILIGLKILLEHLLA